MTPDLGIIALYPYVIQNEYQNRPQITSEKAKARSRAVGRKLKDVQELPVGEATGLLPPNVIEDDVEAAEDDPVGGD